MIQKDENCRIKITKDGPYQVSGHIPLAEKIIEIVDNEYSLKSGRDLPQSETYSLCRCGQSKNAPFCDGTHTKAGFHGDETASRVSYDDRAELLEGPELDLLDDSRCALARFCYRERGNAWALTEHSEDKENRTEAIIAACSCPSGRLTAVDKDGQRHEYDYVPSIEIIQDPEKQVSAGIFVKGYIPIEAADGTLYEVRNRVALCRCGGSDNKPFCDATHILEQYMDQWQDKP